MKSEACSLKKIIILINSSQASQEREKALISAIKKVITTDFTDIKRVKRNIMNNSYIHKLNNSDEMDQFIEGHKLLKLKRRNSNLNRCLLKF